MATSNLMFILFLFFLFFVFFLFGAENSAGRRDGGGTFSYSCRSQWPFTASTAKSVSSTATESDLDFEATGRGAPARTVAATAADWSD